ncbi:MAG: Trk system potassium transporter TrkA [Kiritimatiellae bacterium]|nr:Trk system potassium transporter TrkA [Kiritimatiellia bacterium]
MRIIIIGCGNTGRQLAAKLCGEKHDVVVVDNQSEPLAELESQYDVLTIQGQGSSPLVQEHAEIKKADLLIAVTSHDEVNVLAGILAHSAGVLHTVVRVANSDYIHSSHIEVLKNMGIDLLVSQKAECARELFNILSLPGTQEVIDMHHGKILAVGIKVHIDSPLLLTPLNNFSKPELLKMIRFIAVMRGENFFIPSGETQFMIGDDLYFLGKPYDIRIFLDWAQPEHMKFDKVVIAGGGDIGLQLAQRLESTPTETILVEMDPACAQYCSTVLNKTLVIKGDALDQEALEDINMNENTAFVATTGDDENNIISCLLAEKLGVAFTLAQIAKAEYAPIINSSSLLDRAVSPHSAMINAILRFIRGRNVDSATLLHNVPGELLEMVLPDDSKWGGKTIEEISMPAGSIIATVLRENKVYAATGDFCLKQGDHVVLFSKPELISKLESMIRK